VPAVLRGPDDNGGFQILATGHPRAETGAGEDVDGLWQLVLACLDQQATAWR
jgi:hypothetical protein